jgi:hypothetical protein
MARLASDHGPQKQSVVHSGTPQQLDRGNELVDAGHGLVSLNCGVGRRGSFGTRSCRMDGEQATPN